MGDLFMRREAVISGCGQYRYLLRRVWDEDKEQVTFVMLNPSTADAETDDATIRSCVRLSKSWGYGGFGVVNLFAWRATDPKELTKAVDPIGPMNDDHIETAVVYTDFTVCAWGAHKMAAERAPRVLDIICRRRDYAHCIGTTKSGAPKHPLYIKTGTMPEIYP